jgi:hypothetical protein
MDSKNKVKIYIIVQPLNIKFGQVFQKTKTFSSILNFVIEQTKKIGIKFRIGRINENKTGAILLSDSIIGDFLSDNDEITIYSEDYGFLCDNLQGDNDNTSGKKIFYRKNVSDFYKPFSFLKKKRKESTENNKEKIEERKDKNINEEEIRKEKEKELNYSNRNDHHKIEENKNKIIKQK